MAKDIKIIQCPKCGSTDKTEIKPGFFKCNNCNTEYFLDDDAIKINENIYENRERPASGKFNFTKKSNLIMLAVIAGIIAIPSIIRLLSSTPPKLISYKDKVETAKKFWGEVQALSTNANGDPILICIGDDNENDNKPMVVFKNLQTNKVIKSAQIAMSIKDNNDFEIKTFVNNEVYIITNKTKIFHVNTSDYTLQDVSSSLFLRQPRMSSGIAEAKIAYTHYGQGFTIKNNEDISYVYFPSVDRLIEEDSLFNLSQKAGKKRIKGQKLIQIFQFLQFGSGSKLSMYFRHDDRFELGCWQGDNDEEQFIPTNPFIIIDDGTAEQIAKRNFTPDRKYFDPKLVYYDSAKVIYAVHTTPADQSPFILQCIDAKSAVVLWTLSIGDNYIQSMEAYRKGYMALSNKAVFLIGLDGKLILEYKGFE